MGCLLPINQRPHWDSGVGQGNRILLLPLPVPRERVGERVHCYLGASDCPLPRPLPEYREREETRCGGRMRLPWLVCYHRSPVFQRRSASAWRIGRSRRWTRMNADEVLINLRSFVLISVHSWTTSSSSHPRSSAFIRG